LYIVINKIENLGPHYIGGQYKNSRTSKYHPDLVTDPKQREELEKALEIIREKKILPVKY